MTASKRRWLGPALIFILVMAPSIGFGQSNAPTPLPPAAQEALNKGIIAAKVPDYLLAIRYFEEARKLAPDAPVVYLNLGLAESKIPSRELRAIAWFGVYLAAHPDAPNAAAVKAEIATLDTKNHSNVLRLMRSVENAASQLPTDYLRSASLGQAAVLYAKAGDFPSALKIMTDLGHDKRRILNLADIAESQILAGDVAGSRKTLRIAISILDRVENDTSKYELLTRVATVQARTGELKGSLATFASAQEAVDAAGLESRDKDRAYRDIARAEAEADDIAGAQKTIGQISEASTRLKFEAYPFVANALARNGDITGALKIADLFDEPQGRFAVQMSIAKIQAMKGDLVGARKIADFVAPNLKFLVEENLAEMQSSASTRPSGWLTKLNDGNWALSDCPLNTAAFLDLAGYLKSLSVSEDPNEIFDGLHQTAKKIVVAGNVITEMLKQQAIR